MKRIEMTVEDCKHCPFFQQGDCVHDKGQSFRGHRMLYGYIPDWCPLPDEREAPKTPTVIRANFPPAPIPYFPPITPDERESDNEV